MFSTQQKLEQQVSEALARAKAMDEKRVWLPKQSYLGQLLKQELAEFLASKLKIKLSSEQLPDLQWPPAHIDTDLAISLFELAKNCQIEIKDLRRVLADAQLDGQLIANLELVGAVVNLRLNAQPLYAQVLRQVQQLGALYGENDSRRGQLALVEYSSPNIAKPIGIGHLRATLIGQALANLYHAVGFTVIRENYLGDWGAQFGKLLLAYNKWQQQEGLGADPIARLKERP